MEQAIQAFLADLKIAQGRASNTLAAYRTDLAQFDQAAARAAGHEVDAGAVAFEHVDAYVDWLTEQGYRASTVARKMAAVRSFLRFVRTVGGPRSDALLARLKPPAPAAGRKTRVLTRAEVKGLLAAPAQRGRARDLRDAAILAILYETGIRAEQAVDLRTFDIDLSRSSLRAKDEQAEKPLADSFEPLRIYLTEVRPQLLAGQDHPALFLNQRGGGLSRQGLWLVVKRWAEAIGLKGRISPHTLRRSRAEHLLEDGWKKRDVQRFLGLNSPNTLRGESPNETREDHLLHE